MSTYNFEQLIGKSIYAINNTSVYRTPYDDSKPIYNVKKGNLIGVLYSIVSPRPGRSNTWLMFYDSNNRAYYWPTKPNTVDEESLKIQGVKTIEQVTKEESEKKAYEDKGPIRFYIEKYAPLIIAALIIVPIAKQYISKKVK